jgi:hypothetical protein
LTIHVGHKTEYFLSSHSGRGTKTYLKDALRFVKKQIILQGGTEQIRSGIIRNVGIELMARGYDVEIAHGILNPDNLEGIIIPQLDLALISTEDSWEIRLDQKIFDLNEYRDMEKFRIYKSKIFDIFEQINMNIELLQEELYELRLVFAKDCSRGSVLEERQVLYITEKLLETLFSLDEGKMNHRFGQILTGRGIVNFLPKLLENCPTKYYVNDVQYLNAGRMLNLVAREAVLKGLVVDVYHNFLDPELVELIIIREMNLAIGIKPFTKGFKRLITYEGNRNYSNQEHYMEKLDFTNACKWLEEIEILYDQCFSYYNEFLNFEEIFALEKQILAEIILNT